MHGVITMGPAEMARGNGAAAGPIWATSYLGGRGFQPYKLALTWRGIFSEFSGVENDVDIMTEFYQIFLRFFYMGESAYCAYPSMEAPIL